MLDEWEVHSYVVILSLRFGFYMVNLIYTSPIEHSHLST